MAPALPQPLNSPPSQSSERRVLGRTVMERVTAKKTVMLDVTESAVLQGGWGFCAFPIRESRRSKGGGLWDSRNPTLQVPKQESLRS